MKEKTKEPDLIDRIANALPSEEMRTAYYREMRHLRSLPENDEMLRILRAMMFLTLLTEQVPERVLAEREKLEIICSAIITTTERLETTGSEYYRQLDQRLIELPGDIAAGISPKAIVELITDDLKKQFTLSTIPTVANELAAQAVTIKTDTKEYAQANKELCNSWQATANKAHETIEKIESAVSGAATASQKAAMDFSNTFKKNYTKTLLIIGVIVLGTGIMIGVVISDHFTRLKTVYEIPPDVQIQIDRKKEWDMKFAPQKE